MCSNERVVKLGKQLCSEARLGKCSRVNVASSRQVFAAAVYLSVHVDAFGCSTHTHIDNQRDHGDICIESQAA